MKPLIKRISTEKKLTTENTEFTEFFTSVSSVVSNIRLIGLIRG